MSSYHTNDTGCIVSVSHITGDVVCQEPGPDCDCLIVSRRAADEREREQLAQDLALNDAQMWANLPPSAQEFYRREAAEELAE